MQLLLGNAHCLNKEEPPYRIGGGFFSAGQVYYVCIMDTFISGLAYYAFLVGTTFFTAVATLAATDFLGAAANSGSGSTSFSNGAR